VGGEQRRCSRRTDQKEREKQLETHCGKYILSKKRALAPVSSGGKEKNKRTDLKRKKDEIGTHCLRGERGREGKGISTR